MDLLDQLPPRRRAVLVLRYCCDMSIEQTARALGCSAGTVKSQSARALATLRDRLGPAGF
ncbi:sigma-70 family RNA polymerase sigma factor [Dactylosporangium salmoneum]|uniref:sigma-70 family RNA polymerase sigma factor n=1 Tax=Dactylosporangium salmoneum TaxID=53361 RepID=UPI0031D43C0F